MQQFEVGQTIIATSCKPFPNTKVYPPLVLGVSYEIKTITLDKKGNQHLDVGLKSEYNYITSQETGEELPDGDRIHWCHPSRFQLKA